MMDSVSEMMDCALEMMDSVPVRSKPRHAFQPDRRVAARLRERLRGVVEPQAELLPCRKYHF